MRPRRLPDLEAWAPALAQVADECFGPVSDAKLAEDVRAVSQRYTRERGELRAPVASGRGAQDALRARLRFFLPRDLPKALAPLDELARADALPAAETWRVLDLGAGLGTTSLAAAFAAGPERTLRVDAVDHDGDALDAFHRLAEHAPALGLASVALRRHVVDLSAPPKGTYDLILAGLALNENTDGRALLAGWAERLADDGSVVVLEPALRETTRPLMALRDAAVAEGWTVFSPCVHATACPMLAAGERDWCHEEFDLRLPVSLAAIARRAGLRDRRLTFASLVLRRDGRTSSAGDAARVVSSPLVSKGKRELVLCDAAGLRKVRRLDRHASEANAAFGDAARGDLLVGVEGVKVGPDAAITRR